MTKNIDRHTLARLLIGTLSMSSLLLASTFSMAAIVFECDPFSMVNEEESLKLAADSCQDEIAPLWLPGGSEILLLLYVGMTSSPSQHCFCIPKL